MPRGCGLLPRGRMASSRSVLQLDVQGHPFVKGRLGGPFAAPNRPCRNVTIVSNTTLDKYSRTTSGERFSPSKNAYVRLLTSSDNSNESGGLEDQRGWVSKVSERYIHGAGASPSLEQ